MAIVFPSLGRVLAIIAITVVACVGLLVGLGLWAEHANRERGKQNIAELKVIFAQMLADGVVPEPRPGPDGFQVFGTHSGYRVHYLSADGRRHGFHVSTGMGEKSREWTFYYLEEPHHLLYHPRLKG